MLRFGKIKNRPAVYMIVNIITGSLYIGSSKSASRRYFSHKYNSTNSLMEQDRNKYGDENFVFEVLIYCQEIKRHMFEDYLISACNPYYNFRGTKPKSDIKKTIIMVFDQDKGVINYERKKQEGFSINESENRLIKFRSIGILPRTISCNQG
jgi:group I intron endonuclease